LPSLPSRESAAPLDVSRISRSTSRLRLSMMLKLRAQRVSSPGSSVVAIQLPQAYS
jgi:hypothetical protein